MAELIINTGNIKSNIKNISKYLNEKNIQWSLITKVFSGDIEFLNNILQDDIIKDIHSVGDSRLISLKNLKKVKPELITIYIKPPAAIYADEVVKYADISLNSSYVTISALDKAAKAQNKIHKVIIMLELGELREGVLRKNIMNFYKKVFKLSNIEIIGIGSNLGCMYGVEPTYDKLYQLSLYKQLLEAKFDWEIDLVSGGSSITLPLVEKQQIPHEVNHFRIGEAAFFGASPYDNEQFRDLSTDTFNFYANIIELEEKDVTPDGVISEASIGHISEIEYEDEYMKTYKAITDFGLLDVDVNDIEPADKDIKFIGTTSDMTVYDLGNNKNKEGNKKYKIGDKLEFKSNYIAIARLLNSKFIDKKFR